MDSIEIKKRIRNKEKSEELICGRSLFWAVEDYETFLYYFSRQEIGSNCMSWIDISRRVLKKNNKEIQTFLEKYKLFCFPKNLDKKLKKEGEGFIYLHFKSKNLNILKEFLLKEDNNEKKNISEIEILFLARNCALHGSLNTIKFLYKKYDYLASYIIHNCFLGAIASYFPSIIEFCEKESKKSLLSLNFKNKQVKFFVLSCPNKKIIEMFESKEN